MHALEELVIQSATTGLSVQYVDRSPLLDAGGESPLGDIRTFAHIFESEDWVIAAAEIRKLLKQKNVVLVGRDGLAVQCGKHPILAGQTALKVMVTISTTCSLLATRKEWNIGLI